MRAVTTSSLLFVHAPSVTERPMSAPSRQSVRWRSTDIVFVIVLSSSRLLSRFSVDDEAKIALIASNRFDAAGDAVDPGNLGQQRRLGIRRGRKAVIGA